MRWFFKTIKKALNVKKMYIVEYQTSNMIEPKQFAYEYCEELYNLNRMEYVNETAGQVLTINLDKLEFHLTKPFPIYEN